MESEIKNVETTPREETFRFTGKAGEYFSIWIVNVALSVLTLGIYSAWAKVRTNQYFYGNTYLDDVSFRYLADPKQILRGRIAAFVVFAVYYFASMATPLVGGIALFILMLFVPAFIVMSMSFRLRNSSYRNVRCGFDKNFKRAYTLFLVPMVLVGTYVYIVGQFGQVQAGVAGQEVEPPTVMFFLPVLMILIGSLFPLWDFLITRFKISHSSYGDADFFFKANGKQFYGMYLKVFLVSVLLLALLGTLVAVTMTALISAQRLSDGSKELMVFVPIVMMIVMAPLYMWINAYMQTRRTNLVFNNVSVGGHHLKSDLKVGHMAFLYFTNTLAILLSAGLLIPWAKVRTAAYRASVTSIMLTGDMNQFVTVQAENQSAVGEEVGELFDMDLGV